ncbi:MAG TPA: glycosyltransferase family 4 protein, partial [Gemmataceae bacterium]|nr:glycosyltransferase family 4 protein [Gemmataceae bacterium]
MRILIVSHHALPHIGGPEILVDREIRALAEAGHEVVLVTSDLGGSGHTPVYPPTVRVVRVPAWHFMELRLNLPFPLFGPRLLGVLWREVGRCDVLHAHGFLFMNSALSLAVAWLRGRERILTDHGGIQTYHSRLATVVARLGVETVGRMSARLATKLVSFNTRVTTLLERLAGTRAKTLFLPNPVDRDLFRPAAPAERRALRERLGWEEGRPKVLFVGRLVPDKGVLLLLQAVDPAYDIAFCGPGDPAILGALPRPGVEYLPPRPQAEVAELYRAADLFVLPSYREGFPLVVQEALASGLPVILSDDEGYGPYRGLPGLSFCPLDPAAIRRAILAGLGSGRPGPGGDGSNALDELAPS